MAESLGAGPCDVLRSSGWCRSIGGMTPYLTLLSRSGISRADADAAVSKRQILELPAARGCTYVLPKEDFQIGLTVGKGFREAEMKVAEKLGVTIEEIERLCDAVLRALESADNDPAGLKPLVGDACRSLGEEGRKKGITTTLPVALGRLQARGLILRLSLNGRLDSQRYAYTIWRDGPGTMKELSLEVAQAQVAQKFFSWIGPATIAQFAGFLAISGRAAKAVIDGLPLVPIEPGSDLLILESDLDSYQSFKASTDPQVRLIGGMDNLFHLPKDVAAYVDEKDLKRSQVGEKGLTQIGLVQELLNNAIVDRGRIIGLWEYDADRAEIAWYSFVPTFEELRKAVSETEEFVRDQLGDGRTFSLDSPQSRRPKIEGLRSMTLQTA
jgi:hypothetical protein